MRALFVIDMQEEYVGKGNRYGYDTSTLISRVNQRILKAHNDKELIIYIKNRKNLKSGVTSSEFADGLLVLSDYIFYKDKSSVFSNKEILLLLKESGIKEIETIGVDGNCCVASSAKEAASLGYVVVFPCIYIGVKNSDLFSRKKTLLIKQGIKVIE